jgi:hypothetical protein
MSTFWQPQCSMIQRQLRYGWSRKTWSMELYHTPGQHLHFKCVFLHDKHTNGTGSKSACKRNTFRQLAATNHTGTAHWTAMKKLRLHHAVNRKIKTHYYQKQGHQITKCVTLGYTTWSLLLLWSVSTCEETHSQYVLVQQETTSWETAFSGYMIRWYCQV